VFERGDAGAIGMAAFGGLFQLLGVAEEDQLLAAGAMASALARDI